jgi:hypothetical protein
MGAVRVIDPRFMGSDYTGEGGEEMNVTEMIREPRREASAAAAQAVGDAVTAIQVALEKVEALGDVKPRQRVRIMAAFLRSVLDIMEEE